MRAENKINQQAAGQAEASRQDGARLSVPGNPALLALANARRVLLLQGPCGPFFDRLTRWLHERGAQVHRVVFQGGDRHDCRALKPIEFRGTPEQWPQECERLMSELLPQVIVLFGQSRYYHVQAMKLARARGIEIVVLEEGYFRPGYITMELDGVNGYSRTLSRYHWQPPLAVVGKDGSTGPYVHLAAPESTDGQFGRMAWHAARHYWAMWRNRRRFPAYQHHRSTSLAYYTAYWMRSWFKKFVVHALVDRARMMRFLSRPYFFVPLQHDGDAQITYHSPYGANTEFILQVMTSFARHAPLDACLILRQHPQARGGPGHGRLVRSLAYELGVADRVQYLVEGHTPTLVRHAMGVVVINSTVGLQALQRKKPLKVMGSALYNMQGLSFQGGLDEFWSKLPKPDPTVCELMLAQIRYLTQVPCNAYDFGDEPLPWFVGPMQGPIRLQG